MSTHIKASKREKLGTRACRALRGAGQLPASIQGQGKANVEVAIDTAEFLTARRHHQSLFDIDVEGHGTETAMIREIQYDALGDSMVHVEFRRVTRGVATETDVELVFVGQSRGGVLTPLHRTLRVRAIPSKTPDVIEVNASAFSEGQTVLASQVKLPEGVELATDPDEHVAVVAGVGGGEPEEAAEAGEGEEA